MASRSLVLECDSALTLYFFCWNPQSSLFCLTGEELRSLVLSEEFKSEDGGVLLDDMFAHRRNRFKRIQKVLWQVHKSIMIEVPVGVVLGESSGW